MIEREFVKQRKKEFQIQEFVAIQELHLLNDLLLL